MHRTAQRRLHGEGLRPTPFPCHRLLENVRGDRRWPILGVAETDNGPPMLCFRASVLKLDRVSAGEGERSDSRWNEEAVVAGPWAGRAE